MNFRKYGVVYFLVVAVAAALVLRFVLPSPSLTSNNAPSIIPLATVEESLGITVMVDYGTEATTYSGIRAPNAYLALVEAVKQDNLEVETEQFDFGNLVTRVNGFENTDSQFWMYYINDKAGEIAADQQLMMDGDRLEWKYEEVK